MCTTQGLGLPERNTACGTRHTSVIFWGSPIPACSQCPTRSSCTPTAHRMTYHAAAHHLLAWPMNPQRCWARRMLDSRGASSSQPQLHDPRPWVAHIVSVHGPRPRTDCIGGRIESAVAARGRSPASSRQPLCDVTRRGGKTDVLSCSCLLTSSPCFSSSPESLSLSLLLSLFLPCVVICFPTSLTLRRHTRARRDWHGVTP